VNPQIPHGARTNAGTETSRPWRWIVIVVREAGSAARGGEAAEKLAGGFEVAVDLGAEFVRAAEFLLGPQALPEVNFHRAGGAFP